MLSLVIRETARPQIAAATCALALMPCLSVADAVTMAQTATVYFSQGFHDNVLAFFRSFAVVGLAEVFDKTWFVALMLGLRYGSRTAFTSSFVALALHSVLSAILGFACSNFAKPSTLDFISAAVFGVFFILYLKDCLNADANSDMIKAGKEEASESIESPPESYGAAIGAKKDDIIKDSPKSPKKSMRVHVDPNAWFNGFMAVFIAEWGDRTQIAMIGLHSSMPIIPVFLGSILAFFVLCLSAVAVAQVLDNTKLNERVVTGVVSFSFLLFGLMSLRDGILAKAAGQ